MQIHSSECARSPGWQPPSSPLLEVAASVSQLRWPECLQEPSVHYLTYEGTFPSQPAMPPSKLYNPRVSLLLNEASLCQ
uniref:Uncharacterized protein n=1 Tax=Rhizophora mucronata TaxID=61149 RepID=A0A2P2QC25_RHIMU